MGYTYDIYHQSADLVGIVQIAVSFNFVSNHKDEGLILLSSSSFQKP